MMREPVAGSMANNKYSCAFSSRELASGSRLNQMVGNLAQRIIDCEHEQLYELAVVGIQRRGVVLAREICKQIREQTGHSPRTGSLDITLYRDDLTSMTPNPEIHATDIPFDIEGKIVVLVDDVLFTGRTARAAMDSIIEFGRPAGIRLAVLVDREMRELPIRPDYCALNLETTPNQIVEVHVNEFDRDEGIYLITLEKENA